MNKKTSILKEMGKEIGRDLASIVKETPAVGKKAAAILGKKLSSMALVALDISTIPFVGSLSAEIKKRIYDDLGFSKFATKVNMFSNIAIYGYLASLMAQDLDTRLCLGLGGSLYGMAELCYRAHETNTRILYYGSGSTIGYLPSKAIKYIFEKYDVAKQNIEFME